MCDTTFCVCALKCRAMPAAESFINAAPSAAPAPAPAADVRPLLSGHAKFCAVDSVSLNATQNATQRNTNRNKNKNKSETCAFQ